MTKKLVVVDNLTYRRTSTCVGSTSNILVGGGSMVGDWHEVRAFQNRLRPLSLSR
jgi:hypothetical protein